MTSRLAALLVVVLAGLTAGCGDDDNASQQWASDVCSDLNTWVSSIQTTVKGLTDKGLSIQKSDVQAAVDDAKTATNDLTSGLNDLGAPPDDSAAQQAKTELDQLGGTLQTQIASVARAVDENPSTVQLAQTVGVAVSASVAAAKSTFETIQSLDVGDELKSAFQDADSCKDLRETIDELG
jgi:Family of unknown function (DUF6240)